MNGLESQPTSTRARYGVALRSSMMDVVECSQMLLPTSTRARYGVAFRSSMMDVVECSQMLLLICPGLRSERKRVDMCETDKTREKLNTIQIYLGFALKINIRRCA